jgi:hypothetical protein
VRISKHGIVIVLLAASILLLAQDNAPPPESQGHPGISDVHQIVTASIAATRKAWEARLHYTYTERDESRRQDLTGHVTSEDIDVSNTILVNGVSIRPTRGTQWATSLARAKAETERGLRQAEAGDAGAASRTITKASGGEHISHPPNTQSILLSAHRRRCSQWQTGVCAPGSTTAGYHAQGKYGKMFSKVAGRLWVDKQDMGWIKVDGQVIQPFSMGLFLVRLLRGSQIRTGQVRVDDGIWMPERVQVHAAAKILFVKSLVVQRTLTY